MSAAKPIDLTDCAMIWAADVECPKGTRLVLLLMARHCDYTGHCDLSRHSLAKAAGYSARGILRPLWDLEQCGLIMRNIVSGQGGRKPDTFTLALERPAPAPRFNHLLDQGDEKRLAVFERDGHVCRACGATEGLVLDHNLHQWRGGDDSIENLQLLCGRCNVAKRGRTLEEFLAGGFDSMGKPL